MNGKTKVKFSLSIGVGNAIEDVFTVEELIPGWKSFTQSDLKETIQEEFEEWKNERIDGAWEVIK